MPGAILPPFASPTGPELSREGLLDAFIEGSRTGFSEELHIESDILLANRMLTFAARIGPGSILVRADIPPDVLELRRAVEDHLRSKDFVEVERDPRLGDIAAIQVTGIRGAVWDLWGKDAGQAHKDLEQAVLGTDGLTAEAMTIQLTDSTADDAGSGMTLEELFREEDGPGDEPGDQAGV